MSWFNFKKKKSKEISNQDLILAIVNYYGYLFLNDLSQILNHYSEREISEDKLIDCLNEMGEDGEYVLLFNKRIVAKTNFEINNKVKYDQIYQTLNSIKDVPFYYSDKGELLKYIDLHYSPIANKYQQFWNHLISHKIINKQNHLYVYERDTLHERIKANDYDVDSFLDLFSEDDEFEISNDSQKDELNKLVEELLNNTEKYNYRGLTNNHFLDKK